MKNPNKRHNDLSDTGKIPISQIEREIIERRKQEQYETILRNQNARKPEYVNRPQEREQQPKQKKKKKSGCTSILISIVLILAILTATALGYIYYLSSKMNFVQPQFSLSDIPDNISSVSDGVYNILLIGTDKEEDGHSRSDTMILATIDDNNKEIKLTSFMRDLWVDIPENESGRLNSAYTIGGAPLLMKTISANFDVHIDNYMLVDFEMFQKLIDSLGGVTVEITEKEAKFINRTTHAKVEPGINTLDGDYALIYCRIRKLDSDFMRTQRQRKVINAIIDKIKKQNIIKTVSVANDILPLIQTDISPMKMTFTVISSATKLDYSMTQFRIPLDGAYSNERINGQAVLVPDIEKNTIELHNYIYN